MKQLGYLFGKAKCIVLITYARGSRVEAIDSKGSQGMKEVFP